MEEEFEQRNRIIKRYEDNDGFRNEQDKFKLRPTGRITSSSLYVDDFLTKKFPERPVILAPWLKQGTLSLVYAPRGLGKTWFGLTVAIAVTRNLPIGEWKTLKPTGCLYLDGEMACAELQDRLRQLTTGLPPALAPMNILSSEDMKSNNLSTINLVEEHWRNRILYDLKQDDTFRLLILDNLSCLAPGISENS